jgi:hypothetical protein
VGLEDLGDELSRGFSVMCHGGLVRGSYFSFGLLVPVERHCW